MGYVDILVLLLLVVLLLGGLVSLGMGHRRWSITTVVAAFLVLLAAATYLVMAARVGVRERAWLERIRKYQADIDAIEKGPRAGVGDDATWLDGKGPESLASREEKRDLLQRRLDRVETWHGRIWTKASFGAKGKDAATWTVKLAADGNAQDRPPINQGAHVFLFDAADLATGGAYIGEFLVKDIGYEEESKRHTLTVVETATRDDYDTRVLKNTHDDVIVFEELPIDRWLAFYRTTIDPGSTELAEPAKAQDQLDAALGADPRVKKLLEQFVQTFTKHEEQVNEDEWEAAEREAVERPGTLWAVVTFTQPHSFRRDGEEPAVDGPKMDFEEGEQVEFDLQTAIALRDDDGVVTIDRVFRRRPLTDAVARLHGSRVAAPDVVRVDGTATLIGMLRAEIEHLKDANQRLGATQAVAKANTAAEEKVAKQLQEDLSGQPGQKSCWRQDVEEADALATEFQRALDDTNRALRASEAAIVERGKELTDLMTRMAREIDRVAPPPARRAARP